MEPELELGDDPEVAAAATQRPIQVGLLVGARAQPPAVGGHHLCREQVVAGEAAAAHQVTQPATEGEARDPGRRDEAAGRCQTDVLGGRVELAPHHAAARSNPLGVAIDVDRLHRGEIDDHAAIARRVAGDVVPAGPDRERGLRRRR